MLGVKQYSSLTRCLATALSGAITRRKYLPRQCYVRTFLCCWSDEFVKKLLKQASIWCGPARGVLLLAASERLLESLRM